MIACLTLATTVMLGPVLAVEFAPVVEVPMQKKPLVQIAILLDTSGSMSGLIDQARTELWSLVNEFIFARQQGVQPEVQVALYEYGKSTLSPDVGYVRQIVPLTTDLDKISEELFALKTNGGDEYCGWVIRDAAAQLQWSESLDDLKVIFIAGNEPFTQGPVDYRQACKTAVEKGIIVNTIHCGSEADGRSGMWADGAILADGQHLNIDQNQQVVHIAAPQDVEIAELGVRLNQTYVAYGREGQALLMRQRLQDTNAMQASPQASVGRAVTKSSSNYRNSHWDLVDAFNDKQIDWDEIAADDLPENMRSMTVEEREAFIASQAKERAEIQARIQELNTQRNQFIAEQRSLQIQQTDTLGSAAQQAVRRQASQKNFTFEAPQPQPTEEPASPSEN
jgi:hypothetical protein